MESLVVNRDYELRERVARWLAERGIEKFEIRPEGDVVKVIVNGEEVAEVKIENIKNNIVFRARGLLVDEIGQRSKELIMKIEKGKAEPYQIRALLATDGGYKAKKGIVHATTTSVVQAALYRRFGMKVYYAGYANLTKRGLKPKFIAKLSSKKWIQLVKADLENGVKALSSDRASRGALAGMALGLLGRVEISLKGVDKNTEEGRRKIAEVKRIIMERIEMFARLRLGEGGRVCLANCQFGEKALTYEHEAYARVIAPLIHYIAEDASVEEVEKFLTYAILYDGHVRSKQARLDVGHFSTKKEKLPLDIYDKVSLYMILAAKYSVEVRKVYIGENDARIYFNHVAKMFATAWADFSELLRWANVYRLYDHIFRKLRRMAKMAIKPTLSRW